MTRLKLIAAVSASLGGLTIGAGLLARPSKSGDRGQQEAQLNNSRHSTVKTKSRAA
jgi:hypothetical protein